MLTRDEAERLTKKVLGFSTFPECDLSLTSSENAFIRFALNGITTSGYTIDQALAITSARDGRVGTATVDQFDEESLRAAVKQSEAVALISPPNPEREESLDPQKYPDVENFVDQTARARNSVMIPHVRAVVEGSAKNKLVAAGFFERTASAAAIANKRGNFAFGRTTDSRLSATVRAADGSSSGWASQPAVNIASIDGTSVASRAIEKCLLWKNPRRLEPGRYTVVLEPTAVGDLVQLLGFNFQARGAEEGRSFLSRKGGGTLAGEKLFPEAVTLRTDPFHRLYSGLPWDAGGGFGRRRIGGVGMPAGRATWIDKGVVKELFYDRYWARKASRAPTPFPGRLVLEGGTKSASELIAGVERGLLVTRFWYIRVLNEQTVQYTGLTRDGLFLIENGKVTAPVVNFRFNESPVRLLQNIVAMGHPERVRGGEGAGMIAPALVVKDFPFTSISDAV